MPTAPLYSLSFLTADVTVTPPPGSGLEPVTHEKVTLAVRNGTAGIGRNGQQLAAGQGAVITQEARREWKVTLDDGTVWTVSKKTGCGCGR